MNHCTALMGIEVLDQFVMGFDASLNFLNLRKSSDCLVFLKNTTHLQQYSHDVQLEMLRFANCKDLRILFQSQHESCSGCNDILPSLKLIYIVAKQI